MQMGRVPWPDAVPEPGASKKSKKMKCKSSERASCGAARRELEIVKQATRPKTKRPTKREVLSETEQ
jgi:hypothetical protein